MVSASPTPRPRSAPPASTAPALLHTIPIRDRPRPTLLQRLHLVLFNITFLSCCLAIHTFQLVTIPVRPLQRFAKDTFASVLVLLVAVFGPSRLVITVQDEEGEEEGEEREFTLEEVVRRDAGGKVVGFKLDQHAVWMANHQMYADWIYPWIVMSYAGVASGLVIVLKASLEWAPLVGPAMQLFGFCFINNTTKPLERSNLVRVARDAQRRREPYQCLLFPEGTLYSPLTRPKSRAFAERAGMLDTTNVLLPRSLGLYHTLTTLTTPQPRTGNQNDPKSSDDGAAGFPALTLYDLTIGYPGVPAQGYAQDYYRLQTLFGYRIPPPTVHLHLRRVTVRSGGGGPPLGSRAEFEPWLRKRWDEKDRLMGYFGQHGHFGGGPGVKPGRAELDVRLRLVDVVRIGTTVVGAAAIGWAGLRAGQGVWAAWRG